MPTKKADMVIYDGGTHATNGLLATNAASPDWILRSETFIRFDTGGSVERARLTAAGRLGIGLVAPSEVLHVEGRIRDTTGYLAPVGAILMYGATTAPTGWLLCNGAAVSRTTYADLFTAIGTSFGAGDGSTTFNVPDMRGRAPICNGTGSGLTARTLAATVGTETHTLVTSEIPSHTHPPPVVGGGDLFLGQYASGGSTGFNGTGASRTAWENGATGSTGGGGAHQNMQPSLVVGFIIKT